MNKKSLISLTRKLVFCIGFMAIANSSQASEPVFGFNFGDPVDVTKLCTGSDGFEGHPTQGHCFTGNSVRKLSGGSGGLTGIASALFKYNDLPFWTGSRLKFVIADGKLVGIISSTGGQTTHNSVTRDLTAKYGQPSQTSPQTVRNRLGATFDNTIVMWKAEGVLVTYTPMTEDIRTGQVDFLTPTGLEVFSNSIKDRSQAPTRPL